MAAKHPAVSAAIAEALGYPETRGAPSRLAEALGRNASVVNRWARGESSPEPGDWSAIEAALGMKRGTLKAANSASVSQPDVADVLRRVELLEELVVELRETQAEEAERTASSATAILDRLSTIEQRLTG